MSHNFLEKKYKKNRGFTLVESLVAISIFTVSILAMVVLLSSSISNTGYTKKKIVATYLAQEGIEYIRNLRDTYTLFGSTTQIGWDAFKVKLLNATCTSSNGCYFDDQNVNYSNTNQPMTALTVTACGSSCPQLLYNSANGKYNYAVGAVSGYSRKIRVVVNSSDQLKVISTVFWTQGSGTYNITFEEDLYNWME